MGLGNGRLSPPCDVQIRRPMQLGEPSLSLGLLSLALMQKVPKCSRLVPHKAPGHGNPFVLSRLRRRCLFTSTVAEADCPREGDRGTRLSGCISHGLPSSAERTDYAHLPGPGVVSRLTRTRCLSRSGVGRF